MPLIKSPDDDLDFELDWGDELGTDTITASTWDIGDVLSEPDGQPDTFTDATTTIWLTGGVLDTVYPLTNHITTAGGRDEYRTVYLIVQTS